MNEIDKITLNLKTETGNNKSIEIEVVPNMSLRALHYTIQEKFCLDDRGYHHFALPENCFKELTKNDFSKWRRLVGVFFKSERYVGTGMTYKKITEIEKQESYPCFDIGDTYYESQKKLQHAEKAENILFETLTVGDVFFPKNAKKIIDRDKMLEHLSFIENDAEGAEKALREALLKNDKQTVTFILKASKIYNCPITDTLRYYFNDLHITIIRPNTE